MNRITQAYHPIYDGLGKPPETLSAERGNMEEEKYTTLDVEQCKWWVNHLFNVAKEQACNSHNFDDAEEIQAAQDKIIKILEQEQKAE